ncbi:NnrU family protein [Martelella alba]|uniref:NnrU family protein n=1 Tax=Martelella alba TaxID=2590451 RepID=A0A506UF73_9HYPH|nr:NnrU family protein [Martelella alba]TPW31664.1 NnrU family protein [Martelella alba]
MAMLVVAVLVFTLLHLIHAFAPAFRQQMIDRLGEKGWRGVFSIAALAAFVFMVWSFGQARQVTGVLYTPPFWMAHITILLMLIAMICLSASFFPPGHIARVMKHPMVVSVKVWAFAHLLANGETASVILFAGILIWAVILRIALARRERAGLLTRKPFVSARYDLYAIVLGLVLWGLFVWKLHLWLIGLPISFAA